MRYNKNKNKKIDCNSLCTLHKGKTNLIQEFYEY